jgi:hypothetical protein
MRHSGRARNSPSCAYRATTRKRSAGNCRSGSGRAYRLPSEAEWEYACRAGTSTPFWFGTTITRAVANFDGDVTTPVGSLGAANGFGLFDMHGNVFEWCRDRWHGDYQGAPRDGSAWTSGADQRTRVLRGGSWSHGAKFCRSAARMLSGEPKARSRKIGFRVALSPALHPSRGAAAGNAGRHRSEHARIGWATDDLSHSSSIRRMSRGIAGRGWSAKCACAAYSKRNPAHRFRCTGLVGSIRG